MKIVTSLSFQGQCRETFDFHARMQGLHRAQLQKPGAPDCRWHAPSFLP